MDGDFAEKLKKVLSDPEAMSKITAIASGLGASAPMSATASEPVPPSEPETTTTQSASATPLQQDALPALMQGINTSGDPRISLLASLKPLLREEKRDRVDALARALTLASMMKNFRK